MRRPVASWCLCGGYSTVTQRLLNTRVLSIQQEGASHLSDEGLCAPRGAGATLPLPGVSAVGVSAMAVVSEAPHRRRSGGRRPTPPRTPSRPHSASCRAPPGSRLAPRPRTCAPPRARRRAAAGAGPARRRRAPHCEARLAEDPVGQRPAPVLPLDLALAVHPIVDPVSDVPMYQQKRDTPLHKQREKSVEQNGGAVG